MILLHIIQDYVTETTVRRRASTTVPEHLINGDPRAGEERLIGGDTGLAAVMARARIVSRSSAPVLLFGETGTGKEIIARAIHEHSPFRNGPFRRVNCGAIAPELIDSELFGHEQGAFTGAVTRRKGWFEQADGGTLFLDEVGELALAAQVRLLRVVQDGEVVRVGGERPVRVNVRIVAATHRDLPAMVETQTFREDLYYRLSVFPIVIPPLRDRPSDIRAFAEYFAERAANRFGLRAGAGLRRRCPRAGGVSMAGKRARDGGRDGPRRPDRTRAGAQRGRRPRPGHADGEPAARPCRRGRLRRASSSRSTWSFDVTSRPPCARRARTRRGSRMARRACSGSIRTRCAPACGS